MGDALRLHLNIVYRAGKGNSADPPSYWLDYARVLQGCCTTTILTACCSATFGLQQLYVATIQDNEIFEGVPPDTLANLIQQGQAENYTIK